MIIIFYDKNTAKIELKIQVIFQKDAFEFDASFFLRPFAPGVVPKYFWKGEIDMNDDLQKLADLLGDILEKYADHIDLDSLPDPPPRPSKSSYRITMQ